MDRLWGQRTEVVVERPLCMGAANGEGEREDGVAALAVNATNTARKADSTRRFWLAGSCESCTQMTIYCFWKTSALQSN